MKEKTPNLTLEYYKLNFQELTKRYESVNLDNIHQQLLRCFSGSKKLLELGCGSGRDASFMMREGFDLTATDGCIEMLNAAENYHPELKGRLNLLLLPKGLDRFTPLSFDGVYAVATLMHLLPEDIICTVKKVFSLLKPGGIFFFSVCLEREGIDKNGYDADGRLFILRDQSWWHDSCKDAGFLIQNSEILSDAMTRSGIKWLTIQAYKNG